MKTRKKSGKVLAKQQHSHSDTITKNNHITKDESNLERTATESPVLYDNEWKPARKSKGADEEG
jgi:hypothetical protein